MKIKFYFSKIYLLSKMIYVYNNIVEIYTKDIKKVKNEGEFIL